MFNFVYNLSKEPITIFHQSNTERNPVEEMLAAEESGDWVYAAPAEEGDEDDDDNFEEVGEEVEPQEVSQVGRHKLC